ncbi:alpha/beta fold hydrolase [Undibacterium arcticum]
MPILGIGCPGYEWLKAIMSAKASNFKAVKVENSGHFVQEEQPQFVSKTMIEFLQ